MRWHKIIDAAHPYPENGVVVGFHVAGKEILITQFQNGFIAYDAVCPHEGASLSKAVPDAQGCVTCPLHRYCFLLPDGKETAGRGKLPTYPVEIRNDGLFIGLESRSGWSLW
jgi:nitrite reductase/ring-hydroxylating ferredoxin subunit